MECYCTNHCACQPEALMQCRQEVRFNFGTRSTKIFEFGYFRWKATKIQKREQKLTRRDRIWAFVLSIEYNKSWVGLIFILWRGEKKNYSFLCLHRKNSSFSSPMHYDHRANKTRESKFIRNQLAWALW